jgi:hypothetical protein
MTRFSQYVALACSAIAFSGCASIQSGTTQQVKISSNPAGANVYVAEKPEVNGQPTITNKVLAGVTPLTVTLSRKDGAVLIEKAGYATEEVALTKKMNPWMWGNILLTSPLSTSIDTSTGASKEYDPGEYVVDLKPVAQ